MGAFGLSNVPTMARGMLSRSRRKLANREVITGFVVFSPAFLSITLFTPLVNHGRESREDARKHASADRRSVKEAGFKRNCADWHPVAAPLLKS